MIIAPPNIVDYLAFIRGVMLIDSTILPDSSPVIAMTFQVSMDTVNDVLAMAPSSIYPLAVYNLGGDLLINFAQDQSGAQPFQPNPPAVNSDKLPFFAYMRMKLNIGGFVGGVINSSSDQGTSQSMVTQEAMEMFTLSDIQRLKTIYGRRYLELAQSYGSLVGLT